MTSVFLLLWIVLGISLQLALWLGVSFWRHWSEYQALRTGLQASDEAAASHDSRSPSLAEPASVASWAGFRSFRVDRKEVEDGAQSICSFYLIPEDGSPLPAFLPGQFLTFRLDVPTADGKTVQITRCYSISDAPHSNSYRVSIKRIPAPAGRSFPPGRSSNYFHDHVKVGDRLQVRAPGGHFHIDRSDAPVVLIGGGIGITPVLSMLNWCVQEQPGREVWLYYGVRNGSELIQYSHLEALATTHPNFHLRLCFSNPLPEDQFSRDYQHRGRVDVSLLRSELTLKPYHFYICGPTAMMEGLVTALQEWGVPEARIHYEAFGPSSFKHSSIAKAGTTATTPQGDIQVTFRKSGKQLPWQPGLGNLLEFAEASGIKVASGCRAGSCGTCQTTINAGEVTYGQVPDFDPEPGSCLLCSCTPKTSVTLEA